MRRRSWRRWVCWPGGFLAGVLLLAVPSSGLAQASDPGAQRTMSEVEQQAERLVGSGLSLEQARSLLLERGFSPDQVDTILAIRYPEAIRPESILVPAGARPMAAQADTLRAVERPPLARPPAKPAAEEVEPSPFGYDIFAEGAGSFAPTARVPAGPEYHLGPEDQVVIHTWGPAELNYTLTISPEGHVVIPEIGLVYLWGRTLGEARTELTALFEKYYKGIRVSVTVGALRTIQVYIVGEVTRPGAYTVSSLSTVFTSLYHAGGPTRSGSLRKIRLMRGDGVVGELDLYQYLLEGNRSQDLRVENDDTIFVPPVGPRVTLLGEVLRPAQYELRAGETLEDLLRMSGGALATGYLGRVQIDRILENDKRVVLDVEFPAAESGGQTLADGDRVRVLPVLAGCTNPVWISGAVRRPGRYELKDGMTLLGLIQSAEGLEGDAYLPHVEIERTEPDRHVRILSGDLGAILRGEVQDLALAAKDSVRVYSVWDVKDRDEVEIYGEVRRPGRYRLASNMMLRDLIFRAGGLEESAYLMRAEISRIRRSPEGDVKQSDVVPVPLTELVSGSGGEHPEFLLQPGDKVFVRRIPQWDSLHTVEISGEVRFPGAYALTSPRETLADLFERAGGATEDAFLEAAYLERQGEGRVVVDIPGAVLKSDPKENLALVDGDLVYVPKIPETVQVRGAVFRPSSLKYVPGKSAEYYIRKCGGYLDRADHGRVRITRTSGEVVASRRLWFDPEVRRGNEIVVPFKEEKKGIDWEKIAQVTSVMASLATTAYLITETTRK